MKSINVAIVGATGLVGSTFIKVLEEKNEIKIDKAYFYASSKSAGKSIVFRGKEYKVIKLCKENIVGKQIDYALFSAGGSVSKEFAPVFAQIGAVVIDNSSAWRMEKDVPLVVPEVNIESAKKNNGIIANPNCSTIQCMLPLKALHDKFGLKRVTYTSYQAVSGSGMKGIADLENTTKGESPSFYAYPIYNNCIPHIDAFLENGFTKEEMKMVNETRKILGLSNLPVSATCVRVPVKNSHSIDILAEFNNPVDIEEARKVLERFEGIVVIDDVEKNKYPVPTMATGLDKVLVGRIRVDIANENALRFWCVADNIRKGAASNAVQIMEKLIKGN